MVNLGTESYIDIIAENESCIFDFSDPKFFLEERDIPVITCDLQTPIEYIKKVLKKYPCIRPRAALRKPFSLKKGFCQCFNAVLENLYPSLPSFLL